MDEKPPKSSKIRNFWSSLHGKEKKDPPVPPDKKTTPTANAAPKPASTSPVPQTVTVLPQASSEQAPSEQQLWNAAYDEISNTEPDIITAYEKIVTSKLMADGGETKDPTLKWNVVERDTRKRQVQLNEFVQDGLIRVSKEAHAKEKASKLAQPLSVLTEVVNRAITAAPQAALPWVGVCFALEIMMNPITEFVANQEGIAYVVSRMEWYCTLSKLLDDQNLTDRGKELQPQLETSLVSLYAQLLKYEMNSVCYYYRNRFKALAQDLVKWNAWGEALSDLKDAEGLFLSNWNVHMSVDFSSNIRSLSDTAVTMSKQLGSINTAIEELAMQQERFRGEDADKQCLKHLQITDPSSDKEQIKKDKGGLFPECYEWIFDHADYQNWRDNATTRMLWVKGEPGQGKTMLMCGVVDELQSVGPKDALLSFFFCQATNSMINNAIAVLRGLLFQLVRSNLFLIVHIRQEYDVTGQSLFEGHNAWTKLEKIFGSILADPALVNKTTHLVIDALDECIVDRPKLLSFIETMSNQYSNAKWIVTSRKWPDIEESIGRVEQRVSIDLTQVSNFTSKAVDRYIERKVNQLAMDKSYNATTRQTVLDYLVSNASGTFLWAALVCQDLGKKNRALGNRIPDLSLFPPDLNGLYARMVGQIGESEHALLCRRLLAIITVVHRPLNLSELRSLVEGLQIGDDDATIEELVSHCGSFAFVRNKVVHLVHQSAKEYLLKNASPYIFDSYDDNIHLELVSRSISAMANTLRPDIYKLDRPGISIDEIVVPDPDPLVATTYSCVYWMDHLLESWSEACLHSDTIVKVSGFLEKYFLYWLEALSLLRSSSLGVIQMTRVEALLQESRPGEDIEKLISDMAGFLRSHASVAGSHPLQLYAAPLLFSANSSKTRVLFQREKPRWMRTTLQNIERRHAYIHTMETQTMYLTASLVFSSDNRTVISLSNDGVLIIWDVATGIQRKKVQLEILKLMRGFKRLSLLENGDLAIGLDNGLVQFWNIGTLQMIRTVRIRESRRVDYESIIVSRNGQLIVTFSDFKISEHRRQNELRIWNAKNGELFRDFTFDVRSFGRAPIAISNNGEHLAVPDNGCIGIWDVAKGFGKDVLEAEFHGVFEELAFSYSGDLVLACGHLGKISVWSPQSRALLNRFDVKGESSVVSAFSPDGTTVVTGSRDGIITTYNTLTGELCATIEAGSDMIGAVRLSSDGQKIVSAGKDIHLFDNLPGSFRNSHLGHESAVSAMAICTSKRLLASGSKDKTIKLWNLTDIGSFSLVTTLSGHQGGIIHIEFSNGGRNFISGSTTDREFLGEIKLWETDSTNLIWSLSGENYSFTDWSSEMLVFSPDGHSLSIKKGYETRTWCVEMYNTSESQPFARLEDQRWIEDGFLARQTFSPSGRILALLLMNSNSEKYEEKILLWEPESNSKRVTARTSSRKEHLLSCLFLDEDTLASCHLGNLICFWNVESGELKKSFQFPWNILSAPPWSISEDGRLLAMSARDHSVKICDLSTGEILDEIPIRSGFKRLKFAPNSHCLQSDRGILHSRKHCLHETFPNEICGGPVDVFMSHEWIECNKERALWIPPYYRTRHFAVHEGIVLLGLTSGEVVMLDFSGWAQRSRKAIASGQE